ncbi:MAG: metal-dependent hydrolase [Bdellovibrionota bacterium]
MWPLGHLGIGSKLVSPMSKGLPKLPLFLGCMLPDLIDKPLYYGLSLVTGRQGLDIGLISGTRTFGHTAVFLVALSIWTNFRRSPWLAALTLGVASHLLIDNVMTQFLDADSIRRYSGTVGLLWPFLGNRFPDYPFNGIVDHLSMIRMKYIALGEIVGAGILGFEFWKFYGKKTARVRRGK